MTSDTDAKAAPPRTLLVVRRATAAVALRDDFPGFVVAYPGMELMGHLFDLIVIASTFDDAVSEGERRDIAAWLDHAVTCKLLPGGRVVRAA